MNNPEGAAKGPNLRAERPAVSWSLSRLEGQGPPRISVVVPLCDEAPNVAPLTEQILRALAQEPGGVEIILVDDHSTDETWRQILAARQKDPRVRAVQHSRRAGQSAALWTGFSAAKGEIIATLDGDLQNDPADLPRLLAELRQCDMVCGVRTKRQDNALRRVSSSVARAARKAVFGVDFKDTGCNVRVFKKALVSKLFAFNGIHRFMPILAHDTGAVVRELPVNHQPRVAGKSKYGLWNRLGRGILDLIMVALYRRRRILGTAWKEYDDNGGFAPGSSTGT